MHNVRLGNMEDAAFAFGKAHGIINLYPGAPRKNAGLQVM